MNESQAGNQAVSMVVKLYLGILTGIPELFHAFQDYKTMNYHRELVEQEIVRSGNAVTIAADDRAMEFVRVKLQEKGICFAMAESGHEALKKLVKANGRFLFFCRELDYERILEAVHEVKQELSRKDQELEEEERELEHGREEPAAEEETKEEADEETLETEYQESGESGEEAEDQEKKRKRKKKKDRSSSIPPEPLKPSREAGDRELADWNRKEPSDPEPYRMPEDVWYRGQDEPYRKKEYSGTDSDERRDRSGTKVSGFTDNQSDTENHRPTSGHTAQKDGLADANRNRVTDFHDKTRTEGKNREETIRSSRFVLPSSRESGHTEPAPPIHQKAKSRYPGSTAAPNGGQAGSRKKGERPSVQSTAADSVPDTRKEHSDHIRPQTGERRTSSAGQTVFLGNSSLLPDNRRTSPNSRYGCLTCSNGMSIPSNRMMDRKRDYGPSGSGSYHSAMNGRPGQSCLNENDSKSRSKPPVASPARNRMENLRTPVKEYSRVSDLKKHLGMLPSAAAKGNSSPQNRSGDTVSSLSEQKSPSGSARRIRITRIPMEYLPDGLQYQLGNESYSDGRKTLPAFHEAQRLSYQAAGDILRTRRLYQTRDILSPRNFAKLFRQGRRLAVQSILPRESEGGKIAGDLFDRTSPIAVCMYEKFMAAGAVRLVQSAPCSQETLTAAFAAKNHISYEEAREKVAGILKNQQAGNQAAMIQLGEDYAFDSKEGFLRMISGMRTEEYVNFISLADISDGLKEKLVGIPKGDLDPLLVGRLMREFTGEKDQAFLKLMQAGYMRQHYRGASLEVLFRRYLRQSLKCIGQHSDAGLALEQLMGGARHVYGAYKAGIRLLYTVAGTFKFHPQGTAAQILTDPVKELGKKAGTTAGKITNRAAAKLTGRTIIRKRTVRHASSALKLLANPLKPITSRIMNTAVMKAFQKAAVEKLAPVLAKAGVVLGWAAVILLVLILLLEVVQSSLKTETDSGSVNWNFAQGTEILQEIITELTQKNEAFMAEINDAANHRGAYLTTTGLKADENVTFYEAGAYQVIFRDAYGNELEPSHVDLNNTKAIVSMASRFMPYPFRKLPENVSDEERIVYEELKQHFKDYCSFLWASTHQIRIEEYHPGNSGGIEGAVDNSGLMTTLDKGKCDKEGEMVWLPAGFSPDRVKESLCDTCMAVEGTGLGDYLDDLCTHGKEGNEHGGWRKTGNKRAGVNCRAAANGREHHDFCNHRDGDCDSFTCDLSYYKNSCRHWEYEWVYECGGHMGLVVYVTIGDLSRMPGFAAAGDVDYEAVGKYAADDAAGEGSAENPSQAAESHTE